MAAFTTMTQEAVEEKLEEILPLVLKPARYTGGELNCVYKDHAEIEANGGVTCAVAFPDSYEIGMSNLALSIVYHVFNRREDCVAERTYAPWPDMEKAMRDHGVPLYTLETKRPVIDYHFFALGLSYELSYSNVLNMLDLAGMPIRSKDRDEERGMRDDDGPSHPSSLIPHPYPLVIAGGHATFNPEPVAPFIDIFVIGECEEVLEEIIEAHKAWRHLGREELLLKLANIEGVYVPRFYESYYEDHTDPLYTCPDERFADADRRMFKAVKPKPEYEGRIPDVVKRRLVWDVDNAPYPTAPIIPFVEVIHDRISLEVMRGCTRGCRFCQAGMITRPVREKSPEKLYELAQELIANTGHEDISLVSLSTADYSRVNEVVTEMIDRYGDRKVGVSLPSLRADVNCVKMMQEIQKVRKTGLTFAPEAGTQRMRDVTNKGVTEEDLFAAAESAFSNGWQRIKLYFMISLPTETDEDVIGIADLATRVCKLARSLKVRNPTVTVGCSTFVPKPNTPWQWHCQDTLAEIERKQRLLRSNIGDKAVQFRYHDGRSTHLEAVLSLGDRRVADAIEAAWRLGCKFDSWDEYFQYDTWMKAFQSVALDPYFIANRQKAYDEPLPWDHIDCGVAKSYFKKEDRLSREAKFTPDCHSAPCTMCQACDRTVLDGIGKKLAEKGTALLPLVSV
jgi:radical SAM family uncharacterized protein